MTFIWLQALADASSNAQEARQNAHEAQEKYAEQASKDADIIRRKANETKSAAHQLRGEADHLNGRVVVTENRISKLGDAVKEDNALTDEAKEKVWKPVLFLCSCLKYFVHGVNVCLLGFCRLDRRNPIRRNPQHKWKRH